MHEHHRGLTHMVKGEIDIPSIFSLHHVLESDQVIMSCKSLQVHDFPERPLSISGVSEGIKALLERQHLASALLDGLPDDTIGLQETRGSLNKKVDSRSFCMRRRIALGDHVSHSPLSQVSGISRTDAEHAYQLLRSWIRGRHSYLDEKVATRSNTQLCIFDTHTRTRPTNRDVLPCVGFGKERKERFLESDPILISPRVTETRLLGG